MTAHAIDFLMKLDKGRYDMMLDDLSNTLSRGVNQSRYADRCYSGKAELSATVMDSTHKKLPSLQQDLMLVGHAVRIIIRNASLVLGTTPKRRSQVSS